MDIFNAILAALNKMGIEYLILEVGGIAILLLIYLSIRKMVRMQKANLANLDKYYEEVCKKIQDHHDKTFENLQNHQKEIDPEHLYSKFNKLEDNLDKHESEEIRLLHDISKGVTKIDATLQAKASCYRHEED